MLIFLKKPHLRDLGAGLLIIVASDAVFSLAEAVNTSISSSLEPESSRMRLLSEAMLCGIPLVVTVPCNGGR